MILSGGIVCRYQNNRYEIVPELAGLRGKDLYRVSLDSERNVWISSVNGGAYSYRDGQLKIFGPKEGLEGGTTRSFRDRDGNIWIAADLGLGRIEDSICTLPHSGLKEMPVGVAAIYEDGEGNLWVGGKGLHRFTNSSFTSFGSEQGLPANAPNTVCEDFDHHIWVGTDDGAYQGRNRFERCYAGPGGFDQKLG